MTFWDIIPTDCCVHIFRFLDNKDVLHTLRQVNSVFYRLRHSNLTFSKFYSERMEEICKERVFDIQIMRTTSEVYTYVDVSPEEELKRDLTRKLMAKANKRKQLKILQFFKKIYGEHLIHVGNLFRKTKYKKVCKFILDNDLLINDVDFVRKWFKSSSFITNKLNEAKWKLFYKVYFL